MALLFAQKVRQHDGAFVVENQKSVSGDGSGKELMYRRDFVLDHKPDLDQFRSRGPFAVSVQLDRELRVSAKERVTADLYLSASGERAPLVVFLHGHQEWPSAGGKDFVK